MNSSSLQCDFWPFELPLTQSLKVPSMRQGFRVSGETPPLTHWSILAATAACAGVAKIARGATIAASVATTAMPCATIRPARLGSLDTAYPFLAPKGDRRTPGAKRKHAASKRLAVHAPRHAHSSEPPTLGVGRKSPALRGRTH